MKRVFLLLLIFAVPVFAQEYKEIAAEANELYEQGKYSEAEKKYQRSLGLEYSDEVQYNLANSLYKQGKYKEAAELYTKLDKTKLTEKQRAQVFHNLGNSN